MERTLLLAQGKAWSLIAAVSDRGGVISAIELGRLMSVLAATLAETEPEQGDVLALWASMVIESAGG